MKKLSSGEQEFFFLINRSRIWGLMVWWKTFILEISKLYKGELLKASKLALSFFVQMLLIKLLKALKIKVCSKSFMTHHEMNKSFLIAHL